MRILAAIAMAALPALAAAQAYPSTPIRMIVPFPPGGAADAAARIVAHPMSQLLGQPVVLESRPGADGAIAGDLVLKSPADGYTLLFGTVTGIVGLPVLRKNPPYDPREAFTPISMVGRFNFFLFTHADVPAKSVQELIAYAKANPGKLNYGTGNATAIVATAQFMTLAGIKMVHVPYKGDAPTITDLVAGRVQLGFITTATAMAHAKEGRLRVLATLLDNRSPQAPEVPTMVEAGVRGVTVTPWAALFGPAKLPKEIVDRLSREVNATVSRADVREQLAKQLFNGEGSTPEWTANYVRDQMQAWAQAAKDGGIQPD
jgi:tripartite-type tricarboxylate transporter receptor subunit TctC